MLTISAAALHEYLSAGAHDVYGDEKWIYDTFLDNCNELHEDEHPGLPEALYYELQKLDIKQFVADSAMSENHIGGDNVVSIVDEVLAAIKEGYEIITWYGPNTEALVIGVRPGTIEVTGRLTCCGELGENPISTTQGNQMQPYLTVRPAYLSMPAGWIKTKDEFVELCKNATNDERFYMFEEGPCTEELKCEIYALADPDSSEPFRSAMNNLGFSDY